MAIWMSAMVIVMVGLIGVLFNIICGGCVV
mgnify:CR=1 FL=1|jgi:hypothetical protein